MMNEEMNKLFSLKILNEAYLDKKGRNAAYSIRAFSRDLGISSSQLNKIFNGKRKLSADQACKIALKLQLSPVTFVKLITSVIEN